MKRILFFLLPLIFSCTAKHTLPPDVLPQREMQSILWDMLKADEFVLNFERKDSTRSMKDKSTLLYDEIFRIHKTTKSKFEKSITYYSQHPDLFKDVLDSMEKQKSVIIGQSYKPRPVDSLLLKKHIDSLHLKKGNLPALHK
jgi:hypothetical protein